MTDHKLDISLILKSSESSCNSLRNPCKSSTLNNEPRNFLSLMPHPPTPVRLLQASSARPRSTSARATPASTGGLASTCSTPSTASVRQASRPPSATSTSTSVSPTPARTAAPAPTSLIRSSVSVRVATLVSCWHEAESI